MNPEGDVPDDIGASLQNWHSIAVDYMVRCNLALGDNLKYLVYAALMDHKLQVSGGTEELQTDIKRFYAACSMSDILSQLRESRATQADHSPMGSIDMLTDLNTTQAESQAALTVSITEDSIKLDSSDCNLFCEEWAGKLAKAEYRENALRLKQIIDLLKLKFIQTMNVLKRLLRDAEKDFYTLYRTFLFLRDSGNNEILLHYVSTEGSSETAKVLVVLRDFIQEQTVQ
ncbi:hypothetical protein DPMN_033195 [Dreissena polymorpha]|uniref:Uncharacterized protein n=2 Tax=Dreissena polymorpha TaxID=45954 RepID=A0A9D4RKR7_DREPO|nr:hypothetical protein DPMN_033195 [Dreissena polymorpha]